MNKTQVTRYSQDNRQYVCAGDDETPAGAARAAAEGALNDGETLADDMARIDGCCTWTVLSTQTEYGSVRQRCPHLFG